MKKTFFAIEGLDGVGKTTLINNLLKYGYKGYKAPSENFLFLKKDINSLVETNFLYYITAFSYILEVESSKEERFFMDRYIFSSIVKYVYKTTQSPKDFEKLLNSFSNLIPLPTITFFIDLDYDKRIKRILDRNLKDSSDNLTIEYDIFWNKLKGHYSHSNKIITVNGNQSEEAILEDILCEIGKI